MRATVVPRDSPGKRRPDRADFALASGFSSRWQPVGLDSSPKWGFLAAGWMEGWADGLHRGFGFADGSCPPTGSVCLPKGPAPASLAPFRRAAAGLQVRTGA
jgi:hypothetical protein